MTNHDHIPFIIAAYTVAGVVIAAMIGSVLADHRRLVRALAKVQLRTVRPGDPAQRR